MLSEARDKTIPLFDRLKFLSITASNLDEFYMVQMCIRDSIYMVLIFAAEYVTGTALMALGICPWDYSPWPDQIAGVIRLRFAPLWFATGLLFELITKKKYCI